jgi:hypothetical protein
MGKLFSKVALGWFGRRVLDWGGWLGTFIGGALALYNNLPPAVQDLILRVLTGNWKELTLGALVGLVPLVISQIASFRATVKPQVVTPEGIKTPLDELPVGQKIETVTAARQAAQRRKKPSLLERLTGRPEGTDA